VLTYLAAFAAIRGIPRNLGWARPQAA
jgi:hypothetical protein